ncbi:uncharacterized protein LOC143881253 [Tasmannia lanceolata]|uniref:uncharacterized protein LOC143881253 n=1 Tax=Tasmannia lanceolata TaxID=3420 RepID=UPI004063B195
MDKEVCSKVSPQWKPPPQGLLKVNFDGSSLGNPGPASIGGLCRDALGEVLWSFSGPLGVCDSNEAEVRAMYTGIKRIDKELYDKIIVEEDSKNVIRWLLRSAAPPWRFWSFFDEIEDLTAGSSMVFHHVRRSGNSEADSLARSGVHRNVLEWNADYQHSKTINSID